MPLELSRRFTGAPGLDSWIIAWLVSTDHGAASRIEQVPHVFVKAEEPIEVAAPQVEALVCILKPVLPDDAERSRGAVKYYVLGMRRKR